MLEVAIDVGPLHGHRTGIGNAVAWFVDELDARADDLGITTLRYLTSARATVGPGERRLPIPAAAALRLWSRAARPRVDRWLGKPDLVHGTNYVVPPTRAPRIVSVYDCWFLDHPASAHPDVRLASGVLRRALADGATALVSSEATATRLREHVPDAIVETVHLGPPPKRDALRTDEVGSTDTSDLDGLAAQLGHRPFILSLGTIERRKNVPVLVRAFGRLAGELSDAKLVLAGADGDDTRAVTSALDALPPAVADRVIRTGRVAETTKDWLLDHAAVLAYPSLDEGFGFPLLEAQQFGIPIAASTAGSIPEVAGAGALYSAPSDHDALAANLFGLLDPGARRDAVVDAGARNLDRFSWATCVEQTTDLYRRLAGA
ncbi:MAG: glycosyltransferase family 1 protein [Actinomycetota bacterium]